MSAQTTSTSSPFDYDEFDDENPHPAAGKWNAALETTNVRGTVTTSPSITHAATSTPDDDDITLTVYHGVSDGKPVFQIDTTDDNAEFRINVNDGTIWDSGANSGDWDAIHEAAKDQLRALRLDARNHSGSSLEDLLARIEKLDSALGKLG